MELTVREPEPLGVIVKVFWDEVVTATLPKFQVLGATAMPAAADVTVNAFASVATSVPVVTVTVRVPVAERARQVLERLEAVADITSDRRGHYEIDDLFAPWAAPAIQDGIVCKAGPHRGKESRYADLLCSGEAGPPLIVVEPLGRRRG